MSLRVRYIIWASILFFLPQLFWGQRIIDTKRIKKFPTNDQVMYPYQNPSIGSEELFVMHDPCIQISDGKFVHIWEKSWAKNGYRELTLYNLFLEELSSSELELDRDEDILYTLSRDTLLDIYTHQYDYRLQNHFIRRRTVGLRGGEILETQPIWVTQGRFGEFVSTSLSSNGRYLLLYQALGYRPGARPYYMEDVVFKHEQIRSWHTRTGGVHFAVHDLQQNRKICSDTLRWIGKKKWIFMGADVDDKGNVYASLYDKKRQLSVFQHQGIKNQQKVLTYANFPNWRDLLDTYSGFSRIRIGADQSVYATLTQRIKRGKLRGIKHFQVLKFDFEREEISDERDAEIFSSLKVEVGKVREDFGLRANKRFDNYLLTDLIEMADQSLWLVAQKYSLNTSNAVGIDFPQRGNFEEYAEELIFFEFDPAGKIIKAIIVPSYQRATSILDRTGYFYHMDIDREEKTIRLLTRESSGEKLNGPERLYYRMIDLEKGSYTPRKMIYDGKRKDQYFLKAFTEWLNDDLLAVMILEGIKGKAFLTTINVNAEPAEQETE